MIVVKNSQKQKFAPTKSCRVFEYDTEDKKLGGGVAVIKGRYPDEGYVVNLKVKQIAYVMSGKGFIVMPGKKRALAAGDMIFIDAKEKFAWLGNMKLFLSNAPRFDSKQYRQTK